MKAELLKQAFDKYHLLPISFWKSIADLGSVVSLEKEKTIKEYNRVENSLYFIIKGSGGILLWNKNNFICTDLVLEGDFICDYLSFITREATPYEVLIFEKSTLFKVGFSELTQFTNKNKFGDKFWRYANQALYVEKNLQYVQTITSTATDIYKKIQDIQPEILNRIPQKYIASYLGVTPQSLSRIRKGS